MSNRPESRDVSTLLAAYTAGRVLSRFSFHATQAELRLDLGDNFRLTKEALADLSSQARVLQSAAERPAFQQEVLRIAGDFIARFNQEPDTTYADDLQHDLDACRYRDDALDLVKARISPIVNLHRELRALVVRHCTQREALAVELGEVVERGLRPGEVWRRCLKQDGEGPSRDDPDTTAPDFEVVAVRPGEIHPGGNWQDQVVQVVDELGETIPEGVLRQLSEVSGSPGDDHGATTAGASSACATDPEALVASLDASVRAALSGTPGAALTVVLGSEEQPDSEVAHAFHAPSTGVSTGGRLGLTLTENNAVTRRGEYPVLPLGRARTIRALLALFAAKDGEPVSLDEIYKALSYRVGSGRAEAEQCYAKMQTALSQVRKKILDQLDLQVIAIGGHHWRMVEGQRTPPAKRGNGPGLGSPAAAVPRSGKPVVARRGTRDR
jgi:hypothetical protein